MTTLVDLSHPIEHAMVTHPGMPGPEVTVHLSHQASRGRYAPGTEFEIDRISMVGNTGTYLDAPSHRFAGAPDLAALPLHQLADLPGLLVEVSAAGRRRIDVEDVVQGLGGHDPRDCAVLIHTGWDVWWRTAGYGVEAPFLSGEAARWLAEAGVALVGIDAVNVDDLGDGARPAHTALLAAGVPVLEHLTALDRLPRSGFRLHAAPPAVVGMGTFPVRAYAVVPDDSAGGPR